MPRFDFEDEEQDQVQELLAGALENLRFPAERQDIIRFAQERHAPEETVIQLAQLPNRTYHSLADVIMQAEEPRDWSEYL